MTIKWTTEDEERWQRFTGGRLDYGTNASVRSKYQPTRIDLAYKLLNHAMSAWLLLWLVCGVTLLFFSADRQAALVFSILQ